MSPAPRSAFRPLALLLLAASSTAAGGWPSERTNPGSRAPGADDLLIVDCLLPGQLRRLGTRTTYLSARRPARLPARDCRIRGGEYVAYDRADLASALAAWLPAAEGGDREAQTIVGEIYERGVGTAPDPAAAVRWYRLAAEAGDSRAQVNLGHLYEKGLGVAADPRTALQWYRRAAGLEAAIELDAAGPQTPPSPPSQAVLELERQLQARTTEVEALRRELEELRRDLESRREAQRQRLAELEGRAADAGAARDALERERRQLELASRGLESREQELAAQRSEIERLRKELEGSQALASEQRRRLEMLEAQSRERLLAGPKLTLVEPELLRTRDIVPVATTTAGERSVVGRVAAPAGLASLTVNDTTVDVNELGVFTTRLRLAGAEMPVRIVAVDRQGKREELRFSLRGPLAEAAPAGAASEGRAIATGIDFGVYHALVIGNDRYQTLPNLASAVNDATEIARVLETRYGFRVTSLLNATRYEILSALNRMRETLTARDNLLIYFAGHGELDEVNQRGHWLPVDAERESTANWIPTTAVTDILNIMRAKQILVIVDSCYAGALTRSSVGRLTVGMTSAERLHWYRTMANKRSRTVLTSGGLAPVLDAGGGRHSVFARALLEVLGANEEPLDGQRLHREVAARVAYAAANLRFDQVPEYAPIRFAGHEAGEFFLVPRS